MISIITKLTELQNTHSPVTSKLNLFIALNNEKIVCSNTYKFYFLVNKKLLKKPYIFYFERMSNFVHFDMNRDGIVTAEGYISIQL
jgi:hypothetical protein